MSLVGILILMAVVGFAAWLIFQIEMPPKLRNIFVGVLVFVVVIIILGALFPGHGIPKIPLN